MLRLGYFYALFGQIMTGYQGMKIRRGRIFVR